MSILGKMIDLLSHLSENQLEKVFGNIVGILQDTGKSLEDYREERIRKQYGVTY